MRKFFIEAKLKIKKIDFDTKQLPKKLGIVTTVQYLGEMKKMVDFLWKKEIKAIVAGQILGCDASNAEKIKSDVDAYLYVGTGEFHPIEVALKTAKPVFTLHPIGMNLKKIDEADIEKIRKKKKGMLLKFHTAENIGVLISTKKGQLNVQSETSRIKKLEKRYPDKRFYHFICDTLNFSELENFPFVECWVNTMCPRIMEDINVLNIEDLLD